MKDAAAAAAADVGTCCCWLRLLLIHAQRQPTTMTMLPRSWRPVQRGKRERTTRKRLLFLTPPTRLTKKRQGQAQFVSRVFLPTPQPLRLSHAMSRCAVIAAGRDASRRRPLEMMPPPLPPRAARVRAAVPQATWVEGCSRDFHGLMETRLLQPVRPRQQHRPLARPFLQPFGLVRQRQCTKRRTSRASEP